MFVSKKIIISDHPLYQNPQFHTNFNKIKGLLFCLTKRDNNCFYTATTHCILNSINVMDEDKFTDLKRRMQSFKPLFEEFYGSGFVFDDFFETMICEMEIHRSECIGKNGAKEHVNNNINLPDTNKPLSADNFDTSSDYHRLLEANMSTENQGNYTHTTAFIKLIISTFIKSNRDRFEPFIGNVDDYCKFNVDAMDKDAGYVEISALSEALNIEIEVFQVENGLWQKYGDFTSLTIYLLHTPGHFEPLFKS